MCVVNFTTYLARVQEMETDGDTCKFNTLLRHTDVCFERPIPKFCVGCAMRNVVIVGNIRAHPWWFFLLVKRLRIHDNVGVDFTREGSSQMLT